MKKIDKALDMILRCILFGFCLLIYITTFVVIKENRGFLLVIGTFATVCSTLYLIEGILDIVLNRRVQWLHVLLHSSNKDDEPLSPMKKVVILIAVLIGIVISCYLIGVFFTVFIFMSIFPFLWDRQNIIISILVACATTGLFYYVFVISIGMRLTPGILFGF